MRRRHVIRAAATITATHLLAACAVPVGSDQDGAIAEAREAAEKLGPVVPLPYRAPFRLHTRLLTHPFMVAAGASIVVIADGRWDRPASCPPKAYTITLHTATTELGPEVGTARSYPSSGATHRETFAGLRAGKYALEIDTGYDNPNCSLIGDLVVASP